MGEQPLDGRGILYPARLPTFHRVPAPAHLQNRIRWFWIPQWRVAPGRTSRQSVLPFPASNLVVYPDAVTLAGPTTRVSHRDLTGCGWVVGALLRPAAVRGLGFAPAVLRDAEVPLWRAGEPASGAADVPVAVREEVGPALEELCSRVRAAMGEAEADEAARAAATVAFVEWIETHVPEPDAHGDLANRMEDLIAGDGAITRIEQVAERLGVSVRSVQRVAQACVGLPPLAIIRRYRLQEAAQRLREDRAVTVSRIAAELGYADHAHLTADFRRVLGLTPSGYREER
jgi:AraC-like DNA-binding protein